MYLSLYLVSLLSLCLQLSTMLQSNLWFCLFRCFCVFVLLVSFPFWSMPHDLPDQAQRRQKLPSSLMYTSFIKPVMQVCHQDNLYKSFLCIHAKLVHVSSFRERWHYQIGWISGKIPNGLWPPPLIFGKLCCKLFVMDMVGFMEGGIGQIVSVNTS